MKKRYDLTRKKLYGGVTEWKLIIIDPTLNPSKCFRCGKHIKGKTYFCNQTERFICEYCEMKHPNSCGHIWRVNEHRHDHFNVNVSQKTLQLDTQLMMVWLS